MSRLGVLLLSISLSGACSYGAIHLKPQADAGVDGGIGEDADAGGDAETATPLKDSATDADVDADAADGGNASEHSVEPLYVAAPNWNDYVLASDTTKACTRSSLPALGACIHAGPLRKLALPSEHSCADLEISDSHDWFDWQCKLAGGSVVFSTSGLKSGVDLLALLDTSGAPSWRTTVVTVRHSGNLLLRTKSAALWKNAVHELGKVSTSQREDLSDYGAVYVITGAPTHDLRIAADKISLIKLGNVTMSAKAPSSNALLATSGARFFLWVDLGDLDVTGHAAGVELDATFSVLRHLSTTRAPNTAVKPDIDIRADATLMDSLHTQESGVRLLGAHCDVHDVSAETSGECLRAGLSASRIDHVRLLNCDNGFVAEDVDAMRVSDLHVDYCAGVCVQLGGVTGSTFEDVYVERSDHDGVVVGNSSVTGAVSENDSFASLFVANNAQSGIVLGGRNHRMWLSIVTNDGAQGLQLDGSNLLLLHTTSAQNGGEGVQVGGSSSTLINTVSSNNQAGVTVSAAAENTTVIDLFAADNTSDLVVNGDNSRFSGAAKMTASSSCTVASGLSAAGIAAAPCTSVAPSDAVFTSANTFANGVVGELTGGDPLNGSSLGDNGGSVVGQDWYTFSNRWRAWAPDVIAAGPDPGTRGACSTSPCSLWDWRVAVGGPLIERFTLPPFTALSSASHARTHTWSASSQAACENIIGAQWTSGTCSSTFVDYAYESTSDGLGNDNGLCEAGEACTLNRNLGGYPGEGTLESLDPGTQDHMVGIAGYGSILLSRFTANGD